MTTQANTTKQPAPGEFYSMPGANQFFSAIDSIDQVVVTGSQTNEVVASSSFLPLDADNVTFGYTLETDITQDVTLSTGSATASAYYPYNYLQDISLSFQAKNKPIDVASGVDLYIMDLIRPQLNRNVKTNGAVFAFDNTSAINSAADNLLSPFEYGDTADTETSIYLEYKLPVSIYIDDYFDLALDGTWQGSSPIPAVVSPQYMGGTNKNVSLNAKLATGSSSSLDHSPFTLTSPASMTFSANFTLRRRAVYSQNNPAVMPPIYNWQYKRFTTQVAINGSKLDIPLNNTAGQILSFYIRGFDPNTNAPIPNSDISEVTLQLGSAIALFQGSPRALQSKFISEHGYLLPPGVLAYDFAMDIDGSGRITNANALNTLTEASPTCELKFGTQPGSGAYYVIGYEMLVPVFAGGTVVGA